MLCCIISCRKVERDSDYATELLTPMYENLYVKKFVLFRMNDCVIILKKRIDGNSYSYGKKMTASIRLKKVNRQIWKAQ